MAQSHGCHETLQIYLAWVPKSRFCCTADGPMWGCKIDQPQAYQGNDLCYAIVLPDRKSCFRAGFRPESNREKPQIGPPAGLRPAGGPIWGPSRLASGRNPTRKPDFRPEAILRNIEYNNNVQTQSTFFVYHINASDKDQPPEAWESGQAMTGSQKGGPYKR